MKTPDLPTAKVYRTVPLEVRSVELAKRADDAGAGELLEMEFAFASETAVERYFGFEKLEVTTKAARLERVVQGVSPVLDNHNSGATVGRVLSVKIGSDRIARALVRFSRSAAARDVVQDVVDGIRQGVSFGYRVHKMELIETGDDGDSYRVTDWEFFELTISSMPADPTVGVHRSADESAFAPMLNQAQRGRKERIKMTMSFRELSELTDEDFESEVAGWPAVKETAARENRRRSHIDTIATEFRASDSLRDTALGEGWDPDRLLVGIREERARNSSGPLSPPDTDLGQHRNAAADFQYGRRDEYGLDGHDTRGWSLFRAVGALASGRPEEAALEFEVSDQARRSEPDREYRGRGLTVPSRILGTILSRAVGKVSPNTTGAALVGTDHLGSMFIDFLRPRLAVFALGATVLPARVGDIEIPKQVGSGAVGWVAENSGSGESSASFGAVGMTPHTARARADITRRMLKQSEPAVEQLIVADIQNRLAQAIDFAALAGAGGGSAEPEGILNTSGVGSVTYDATSGATERQSFIALQDAVAAADVDLTSPAALVSTSVRARLQGLSVDPGSGVFVWEDGDDPNIGRIAGIRAAVSNNVPRDLGVGNDEHAIIFGNWSDLLIAMWSSVDLMTDDVTLGDSGGLVLRAFQDVDAVVRHSAAFSVSQFNPNA